MKRLFCLIGVLLSACGVGDVSTDPRSAAFELYWTGGAISSAVSGDRLQVQSEGNSREIDLPCIVSPAEGRKGFLTARDQLQALIPGSRRVLIGKYDGQIVRILFEGKNSNDLIDPALMLVRSKAAQVSTTCVDEAYRLHLLSEAKVQSIQSGED
ncbi:hypothetical protein ACQ4M4_11340 [Leptolyngbya sp. AN02str]|uniref:hypothetical protein n=1 Tax=Leptolyngbya sp. AN02str TaxID=3423363 RepID=UPI003D314352